MPEEINAYLFDMDGTLNMGEVPIPGAMETLKILTERGKKVIFVTNNSTRSRYNSLEKVRRMGYDATIEQVISAGYATIYYLNKNHKGKRVYVVGTTRLKNEMKENGIPVVEENEEADILVLAHDLEVNYEKLWHASNLIMQGKPYIATHPDMMCPTDKGNMPDVGAFIALLEKTTGRMPNIVIGKPNKPMAECVFDICKIKSNETAFVGDRLYTDMEFAINNDMTSILVMSGETTEEMLKESGLKIDYVFDDVNALRKFGIRNKNA